MKITLIGGGGYAWTPILMTNFLLNDFFKDARICLMDVNEEALNDIVRVCRLYASKLPENRITFETTTDLDQSIDGAAYVIMAIAHGGANGDIGDHAIGRKFGYFNMCGEEVGVAGCSRTLRHVPEAVRIARRMEKLCPSAVFINVSNPLTAITRAINKYSGIKAYGFCHGVTNHLPPLFPLFGADSWDGVEFNVAGVDHCSWLLDIRYKGKDALAIMKDKGLIESAQNGILNVMVDDPFADRETIRLRFLLWGMLGHMPAISDRHIVEFFAQIIGNEELRSHYGIKCDRPAEKVEWAGKYKDEVLQILKGEIEPQMVRRNEIVDKFICALNGGGAFIDVMNVPNQGQISNLPLESVVETKCLVDSTGVHPIHAGKLPAVIESIVRPIILRQELYMEAAMENNFNKLRSALSTDPSVNDFRKIDDLCRELMDYNKQFRIS